MLINIIKTRSKISQIKLEKIGRKRERRKRLRINKINKMVNQKHLITL